MGWDLTVGSAPFEDFAATPGLVNYRTAAPAFGSPYDQFKIASVGKGIPTVSGPSFKDAVVELENGSSRRRRRGKGVVSVKVDLDGITGAEWKTIQEVIRADRLVMFDPNYDRTTLFSANFGGQDKSGGLALVGESGATQYTGRMTNQGVLSRIAGLNGLVGSGLVSDNLAKIVPGMIGNAVLIESGGGSLIASANPVWTAVGTGTAVSGGNLSNNGQVIGKSMWIPPDDGTRYARMTNTGAPVAATVYTAWVDVIGTGVVVLDAVHGATASSADTTLDPKNWTRVHVTFTQSGGTLELRLRSSGFPSGVSCRTGGVQIEDNPHPTSWMGINSGTNADKLAVVDTLPLSTVTFAIWYKYRATTATRYFWSANSGGTDYKIKLSGTTIAAALSPTSSVNIATGAVEGEWTQLVVVGRESSGAYRISVYENGALLVATSFTGTNVGTMPTLSSFMVGSDEGIATPLHIGLDTEMDSFRVDLRAWTAAEVASDYYKRISGGAGDDIGGGEGMRAFLEQVQGRLFQVTGGPSGFRGGLTDDVVGQLSLQQVAHIEAATP